MKDEGHFNAYKEHREAIFEWALEIKGLANSQRIVGTHASRGIVELLAFFMHKNNLITSGFQLNHTWFKSEKVIDRLPEFGHKKSIVKKMIELEILCEDLSYGSPKTVKKVKQVIKLFEELENKIRGILNDEKK